jgi:hypothetical protein
MVTVWESGLEHPVPRSWTEISVIVVVLDGDNGRLELPGAGTGKVWLLPFWLYTRLKGPTPLSVREIVALPPSQILVVPLAVAEGNCLKITGVPGATLKQGSLA